MPTAAAATFALVLGLLVATGAVAVGGTFALLGYVSSTHSTDATVTSMMELDQLQEDYDTFLFDYSMGVYNTTPGRNVTVLFNTTGELNAVGGVSGMGELVYVDILNIELATGRPISYAVVAAMDAPFMFSYANTSSGAIEISNYDPPMPANIGTYQLAGNFGPLGWAQKFGISDPNLIVTSWQIQSGFVISFPLTVVGGPLEVMSTFQILVPLNLRLTPVF